MDLVGLPSTTTPSPWLGVTDAPPHPVTERSAWRRMASEGQDLRLRLASRAPAVLVVAAGFSSDVVTSGPTARYHQRLTRRTWGSEPKKHP